METGKGKIGYVLAIGVALLASSSTLSAQQAAPAGIPLTVDSGLALRLIVTQKVRYKLNEPVHSKITDSVFAYDREVIPPGAEVTGKVSGFRRPSRWIRAWTLMGGNFTPMREPQIEFDKLTLADGTTRSLTTEVSPGTNSVVRFSESKAPPKGRIAVAKDMARQQIQSRKQAVIDAVKGPGKWSRVRDFLWSFSPYRPQSLPAGTRFTATLQSPLEFGTATAQNGVSQQPADQTSTANLVSAVLSTPLDSKTAKHGMAVDAIVSRPVFSPDNHLVFPEGSHLVGMVTQAQKARFWHRNGKLAFLFTGIQAPESAVHEVEGRLDSVEVDSASAGAVRLDEEGGTSVANSKTRFITPAIAALLAIHSTEGKDVEPDNDADDFGPNAAKAGTYGSNNFASHILSGGIGFGMVGAAIGRLSQPLAAVLGFYGAGRLAYTNIVGRGTEVTFTKNTPLEIRLGPEQQ